MAPVHRAAGSALATAALLAAPAAWACPVCGQGAEGSEGAYLLMSGVLSALPLLMVGGIVVWIVRRARATEQRTRPEEQDALRS